MTNVFDLVEEFYAQDEGWNSILRRECVENYLRAKAWQGADGEELESSWEHIMLLCIYLGSAECCLGDMTRDGFIDCVGWCARNVSGFMADRKGVDEFLSVLSDFYAYLKKKRLITGDSAPAAARELLLQKNGLQMLDADRNSPPRSARRLPYAAPDLPAKIFLNIGERMEELLGAAQTFFSAERYRRDLERAAFLYGGFMGGKDAEGTELNAGGEDYAQCFWDYFLFDYYMLDIDKTPLQHFHDDICADSFSREGSVSRDVLEELLQAELVLFTVEGRMEDNLFSCRNYFTGEDYLVALPLPAKENFKNMLFIGHLFYNKSMVIDFVRGISMTPVVARRFLDTICSARRWAAVRSGGELSWQDFIRRYSILLRHALLLTSSFVRLDSLQLGERWEKERYSPQPLLQDRVSELIASMMKPYRFSAYDIMLAQTMWSDYDALPKKKTRTARLPETWAAGIVYNYLEINEIYKYSINEISDMCRGIPGRSIRSAAAVVGKALALEKCDPRYIAEEGLLFMMML